MFFYHFMWQQKPGCGDTIEVQTIIIGVRQFIDINANAFVFMVRCYASSMKMAFEIL